MKKQSKLIPNYAGAHNNLGVVFNQLGEHHKAKKLLCKGNRI